MKHLKDIEQCVSRLFASYWTHLHDDGALARDDLRFPGVYLLAYSSGVRFAGSAVKSLDVFYVGMSNAAGGVRARLKQFKTGIETGIMHSGAMRFYREYGGGKPFAGAKGGKRLYFAALTFECESDKGLAKPDDLRLMGHTCCIEYYAIAHVAEQTARTHRSISSAHGPHRPKRARCQEAKMPRSGSHALHWLLGRGSTIHTYTL
jgi:hypothetical protein